MNKEISEKEVSDFKSKLMEALSTMDLAANLSRVEDDNRQDGEVMFLFGKYGYSVNESAQNEDWNILYHAINNIRDTLPIGLEADAYCSDKYNKVTLRRY